MRWRARDGGMRLGECVGGEHDTSLEFSFKHDVSSSSADFTAINILFPMVYRDKIFIFHASKKSNLEKKCEDSISTLEDKWFDLFNLDWEGSDYYLTISDIDSESEAEIPVSRYPVSSRTSTGIQRLTGAQMSYLGVPNPAISRPRIAGKAPPRPAAKYIEVLKYYRIGGGK
jgi:hypothetical protein